MLYNIRHVYLLITKNLIFVQIKTPNKMNIELNISPEQISGSISAKELAELIDTFVTFQSYDIRFIAALFGSASRALYQNLEQNRPILSMKTIEAVASELSVLTAGDVEQIFDKIKEMQS